MSNCWQSKHFLVQFPLELKLVLEAIWVFTCLEAGKFIHWNSHQLDPAKAGRGKGPIFGVQLVPRKRSKSLAFLYFFQTGLDCRQVLRGDEWNVSDSRVIQRVSLPHEAGNSFPIKAYYSLGLWETDLEF